MQFMLRISLNVTLYSYVCMLVKCTARIQNCCLVCLFEVKLG